MMKLSLSTILGALSVLCVVSQAHANCPAPDSLTVVWQPYGLRADTRNSVYLGSYEKQIPLGSFQITARWPAACVNGAVQTLNGGFSHPYGYTLDDDLAVCTDGAQSVTMGVVTNPSGYKCGSTTLLPFRYEGFFLFLDGTAESDYIYGGSGVDFIDGWSGNDYLYGLAGNDYLNGYYGDDIIRGGTGNDHLRGSYGRDTLTDEQGFDQLYGEGDSDLCVSDDDNSFYKLECGAGNDTVDSDNKPRSVSCETPVSSCY